MDAYNLIISVLTFDKSYSRQIKNGVDNVDLYNRITSLPKEFLNKNGVRLNKIHRDSPQLNEAFHFLASGGVLDQMVHSKKYIWIFPLTPAEYFEKNIKPNLNEDQIKELEEVINSP